MDAYEATRVVFSRIQALDPDNAAKIMGLLLIQDHGEKEMIRLAFGPESLLHSLVLKARKDLALPVSSPAPFLLSRQSSSSRLMPPSPLAVTSPSSWGQPHPFSRSNSSNGAVGDELQNHHDNELISPTNPAASPFYGVGGGGGDLIDEFQLQDQLSFLNDTQSPSSMLLGGGGFLDECRSPGSSSDGMMLQYGMGWPGHRRSCSVTDSCLGGDPAGFGWRPCLYFARGYCKNGSSCRFLHGLPDDVSAINTNKMDGTGNIEQQCHDALLLRSKSQRIASSQLMASAAAFPYSPTSASMPPSPSSKCMSFLLQQQQNDSQRAAAVTAAAAMMLGGDETHKFLTRSRSDFAGMVNPSSRQIYLTFPADSTFREEDVSNYFSIYGPVQDVRIPYQQKRMFGFVTFVYPETVKLILAKGNPHFVCDSRVLVKPYKEKGKVPDKYRLVPYNPPLYPFSSTSSPITLSSLVSTSRSKQQTSERGDFSGCTTPTGLDPRDPFDLQLGSRMMFNSPDVLLRRKLEEQQQAAELQQAIEMQARRFMGLQLLDLKNRTLSSSAPPPADAWNTTTQAGGGGGGSPPDDKSRSLAPGPATAFSRAAASDQQAVVSATAADTEESAAQASLDADSDFQEGIVLDHNLPDSPFASPTKSAAAINDSGEADNAAGHLMASSLLPPTSSLDMASFKSCFFQMPRFNSSHGAVGM